MQHDASTAGVLSFTQRMNQGSKPLFHQCTDNKRSLPLRVESRIKMLKAAAAALSEIRAGRAASMRRCLLQCNENTTAPLDIGFDALSGKCKRHKYEPRRTVGDALALVSEFANFQSCADHSGLGWRIRSRHWADFRHFSVFLNRQWGETSRQVARTDAKTRLLSSVF